MHIYVEQGDFVGDAVVLTGNWQRLKMTALMPVNASGFHAYLFGGFEAGDVLNVDAIQVETANKESAFNISLRDLQNAVGTAEQHIQEAVADYTAKFANIQEQIDGQVANWFKNYSPTLANIPASDWTTNELKDAHIGDTFTNVQPYVDDTTTPDSGKSWRFAKDGSTYAWVLIPDTAATQALLLASQAQAAADGKSTTF
ncbi:hypothetical protein LWM68_41015 [Niabella sp. W65]|nr:hypothetical protein [Niabella sp. W65]MCH7368555.1 hypothetical protein [Niabella sp. W65]